MKDGDQVKNIIIIGVGGFARELYWLIPQSVNVEKGFQIKGFLDGDVKLSDESYEKLPMGLLGDVTTYNFQEEDYLVCGIGTPDVREKIIRLAQERGGKFISLVHRTAMLHGVKHLGEGIIIGPYAGVGDADEIGNHVVINTASHLGHDVRVGDYSCIMAHVNLMGGSTVGNRVFIGGSATILPHAKIGDDAVVGAGSVVLKSVKKGKKVFGNPAMAL